MKCRTCNFENPTGFAFCGQCGQSLALICARCGFQSPPNLHFCGQCGADLSPDTNHLTQADLDHLRIYLPSSQIEALQFNMASLPDSLLQQSVTHLSYLLQTIASHLPPILVAQVTTEPQPGQAHGRYLSGALLFADVSGFTAMSERLSRIGREGAEEITTIINRYFSFMLAILKRHGGQLLNFGGDALLGLFVGDETETAARTVQVALTMQAAMADFAETKTSQGTFPLRMKIGIHHGRFFFAQLGNTRQMEYALFGEDVNQTAQMESAAVAGQIVLSNKTLTAVKLPISTVPLDLDKAIVQHLEAPLPDSLPPAPPLLLPGHYDLPTLRRAVEILDTLSLYLPAGLLPRLKNNPAAPNLAGEHRLVAVLFASMYGLGDVADQLEEGKASDVTAALNQIFTTLTAALAQFGGVVNKIDLAEHGDKLLVFFGAPVTHEDDAERAVRAALEMQAGIAQLNQTLPQHIGLPNLKIGLKIGISYGYVFAGYVGSDWRHEYTVMGDEVNLAARVMSTAVSGSISVSRNIQRKTQALFEFGSLGEVELKGKQYPVAIYSVAGVKAIPEPLRGLKGMHSALVGREAEWGQLQSAFEQMLSQRGQITAVSGEAGLGKSRLIVELRRWTAEQMQFAAMHWLESRCLSYTESVSYWPFQEITRQLARLSRDDDTAVAMNKLRYACETWLSTAEVHNSLPYLANFLNLELDEEQREKIRYLDGEALQRRTFIALRTLIAAQAAAEPLVIVLDDIHWIDNASAQLLEFLMPLVNETPVMFILLFRPERTKICWQIHEKARREFDFCYAHIPLDHLEPAETKQLLENLVGIEQWPDEAREMIFSRTEGNPLYLEEVLRSLINEGVLVQNGVRWQLQRGVTAINVPDTLQGVMMARLDRLNEPSRNTAQVASVVGRSFPYEVLTQVVPAPVQNDITPRLVQLQQYEIIQETHRAPELIYAFKHTMMQEVCYTSLPGRTRRDVHCQVAHYLVGNQAQIWGEARGIVPLIAHHAYVGQDWLTAVQHQIMAGWQAQQLFANLEALDHFHKALECTQYLPDEEIKDSLQVIYASLGELLVLTSQYDEAQTHLEAAYELAVARQDQSAQALTCRWLARLYELRGDYPPAFNWIEKGLAALTGQETAEAAQLLLIAGFIHTRQGNNEKGLEFCRRALQIAQDLGELTALARANNLLGHIMLSYGQSQTAVTHFQQAFELYDRAGDIDGQAHVHNQMARAFFSTGYWQQAEHHYRQARTSFDQMGDRYHRTFADNNLAEILLKRGELDEAIALYQAALETMEQIGGSAYVLGALRNNLGAAFVRQGNAQIALNNLAAARDYFEQAEARDFLPELYRHLAEAALLTDDLVSAVTHAEEAVRLAREFSMRSEEGCGLRALGDVALAQEEVVLAETYFAASVEILQEVADEYELARSRFSLARAYAAAGQPEAAQEMLTNCLEVFRRLDTRLDVTAVRHLQQAIA
ncbi:MAG: tetratricopeptide repeat protein [Chloroflexi bacterium]|nr:tetratricopeptide repeat protein [Chloroflexota bacterium]